jgi:hypothetical protein
VVDAGDAAFIDHGGGVVNVGIRIDEANDGGDAADGIDDTLEGALVIEDEGAPQEQVLRRVARQRQLREGDDLGAKVAGAASVVDDLRGVAFKITDSRVDLGECDP